jgi:hypothetical protein
MLIDSNSKDDVIKWAALKCHIIDLDTSEDLLDNMVIKWYDTKLKKLEYVLHNSDGQPLINWKTGDFESFKVRFKYRNLKAYIYEKKETARALLELLFERDPDAFLNKELDIMIQ